LEIYILRHGDANADSKKTIDDSKRVLSEAGIKEIEGASRFFAEFGIKFDSIFTSPLKRAKQTATIAAKDQKKSPIVELNELKPEGNVSDLCKRLSKQKEDSVILVVGHNPLLVDLADDVINPENHHATNFSLKTGGLIKIKTTSLEPKLKGQLEWLLSPKLIRKVSK
jgi:phosphohistidine phosphatase SixA